MIRSAYILFLLALSIATAAFGECRCTYAGLTRICTPDAITDCWPRVHVSMAERKACHDYARWIEVVAMARDHGVTQQEQHAEIDKRFLVSDDVRLRLLNRLDYVYGLAKDQAPWLVAQEEERVCLVIY